MDNILVEVVAERVVMLSVIEADQKKLMSLTLIFRT